MTKPMDVFFDPLKLSRSMMAAQIETALDLQKLMLRQMTYFASDENALGFKMTRVDIPVPAVTVEMDETRVRERFHAMADANIAAWTRLAEIVQSMPGWSKWAVRAPGEFWTGVFDKYSTLDGMMPTLRENAEAVQETTSQAVARAAEAAEKLTEEGQKAATELVRKTREMVKPTLEIATFEGKPVASRKPEFLAAPKGKADELTRIKGIGPKLNTLLNELGIFHFSQIAAWTPEQCEWIDDHLAFKGRVQREGWVEQARRLMQEAA